MRLINRLDLSHRKEKNLLEISTKTINQNRSEGGGRNSCREARKAARHTELNDFKSAAVASWLETRLRFKPQLQRSSIAGFCLSSHWRLLDLVAAQMTLLDPARTSYRFVILAFNCLLTLGSYYAFDMPSVLQNELVAQVITPFSPTGAQTLYNSWCVDVRPVWNTCATFNVTTVAGIPLTHGAICACRCLPACSSTDGAQASAAYSSFPSS
jgi:hypothetical protein